MNKPPASRHKPLGAACRGLSRPSFELPVIESKLQIVGSERQIDDPKPRIEPFSPSEREALLAVRGVGPNVIARLEQLGFSSLRQLAAADAASILKDAATLAGSSCWKARAVIETAITTAVQTTSPASAASSDGSPPAEILVAWELRRLANLGPKSATILASAGIRSFEHLRQLGSVAAFVLAKQSGAKVSLNLLWALEGALSGQPWQIVAREHRVSLLLALENCERGAMSRDDRGRRT